MSSDDQTAPTGELILYQTKDGRTRVECRFVVRAQLLSATPFRFDLPLLR